MKTILVIGGTGVAGTTAIQASRERFGAEARVTAVWFARKEEPIAIEGADSVLFGDVTDPAMIERIRSTTGDAIDYLFFATAKGDVGFPILETTPQQIAEASLLSFDPLVTFERSFRCGLLVAYSTFFRLKIQEATYGSMGHVKARIEHWVTESPKHACIRAGAFESESSRAIGLLLRKIVRERPEMMPPEVRGYFEGRTTQEGLEMLKDATRREERETLGDTGTGPEGLFKAHCVLLRTPSPRFVNVCGTKVWLSEDPQPLPTR
jgi:hypothetical protein